MDPESLRSELDAARAAVSRLVEHFDQLPPPDYVTALKEESRQRLAERLELAAKALADARVIFDRIHPEEERAGA